MSSAKITDLVAVTSLDALNDYMVVVDVSDTTMAGSGSTKKVLPYNLPIGSGTQAALDAKVTGISSSTSGRMPLFDGITGKLLKEYTGTGVVKVISGVPTAVTAPTGLIIGDSDAQTLSNKTINGTSNTLVVRLANDVSGILPVANGGTNQSSYIDGQLLIGNTSGGLTKSTITAGSNVQIVNGSGTITISATGVGGGGGDLSGPSSSINSEVMLFNGTTGKLAKSATGSGITKLTSGVLSVVTAPTGLIVGDSDSQTLTGKRINCRVFEVASTGTATPNISTTDDYIITALATGVTFAAPTGTPTQGQKLIIRVTDNGTSRAIAWDSAYKPIGVTLPTATLASGVTYVGGKYNSTTSFWNMIAVGSGI